MSHHILPILLIGLFLLLNRWRSAGRTGTTTPEPLSFERDDAPEEAVAEELREFAERLLSDPRDRETVTAALERIAPTLATPTVSVPRAAPPAPHHRPVKYLLDGDDTRRKVDRIAKLERMMRGKGLCSPR